MASGQSNRKSTSLAALQSILRPCNLLSCPMAQVLSTLVPFVYIQHDSMTISSRLQVLDAVGRPCSSGVLRHAKQAQFS